METRREAVANFRVSKTSQTPPLSDLGHRVSAPLTGDTVTLTQRQRPGQRDLPGDGCVSREAVVGNVPNQ